MNAQQLESYLRNLGVSHDELVAKGIVSSGKFIEVYPGAWTVYLEPVPGLTLSFWAEDKKFESLIFSLAETSTSKIVYQEKLPEPYARCVTRENALEILGEPVESKGPFKMPQPMGEVGGWDKFSLVGRQYPGLVIIVKYDVAMKVVGLAFAVAKTGFDHLRDEAEHQAKV